MDTETVKINWKNGEVYTNFFKNLSDLRRKGKYFDITLLCDGQKFYAHRLVLTLMSGYFAKSFEPIEEKDIPSSILVCGIKAPILKSVLDLIYDGKVEMKKDEVLDFANAGQLLKISELHNVENCDEESSPNTDTAADENVIEDSNDNIENEVDSTSLSLKEFERKIPDLHSVIEQNIETKTEKGSLDEQPPISTKKRSRNSSTNSFSINFLSDSGGSDGWEGWEESDVKKPKAQVLHKSRSFSYKCSDCDAKFYRKSSLEKHVTSNHTYTCQHCHEKLEGTISYNLHLNTHTYGTFKELSNGKVSRQRKFATKKHNLLPSSSKEQHHKKHHTKFEDTFPSTIDDALEMVSISLREISPNGIDDAIYNNEVEIDSSDEENSINIASISTEPAISTNQHTNRIYISSLNESLNTF